MQSNIVSRGTCSLGTVSKFCTNKFQIVFEVIINHNRFLSFDAIHTLFNTNFKFIKIKFLEDFNPGFDELKSFCIRSLPAIIYFKVGYVFSAVRSTVNAVLETTLRLALS